MFTGIITDIGEITAATPRDGGKRFRIATAYDADSIAMGASIACSGVCLTVVAKGKDTDRNRRDWFEVEAWEEALRLTTAAMWREGTRLNLERSLKMGDELGGHIVTGHVDGQGLIVERRAEGDAVRFIIDAPADLARFIAQKGSVALDGTSLTVNRVEGNRFDVLLIDHSLSVTTWGAAQSGDRVNLEIDPLARYVARLAESGKPA
jgi:riboflavin synthase